MIPLLLCFLVVEIDLPLAIDLPLSVALVRFYVGRVAVVNELNRVPASPRGTLNRKTKWASVVDGGVSMRMKDQGEDRIDE